MASSNERRTLIGGVSFASDLARLPATDGELRANSERSWELRLGAVAAVSGAVLAGIGNLLHPITPRDDEAGVAQVIAGSEAWTVIHLVIVVGIVLMLVALTALRATFDRGLPAALAQFGLHAATVGVAVGLLTVMLDAVAAKRLADDWAAAAVSDQEMALALVTANETVNFAMASLFNISFAGAPFILFGVAVALATVYPRWLGWVAVAAGVGSIGAGLVQAFTGEPTMASLVLTLIGPTVISAWVLVIGVLMARRANVEGVVTRDSALLREGGR